MSDANIIPGDVLEHGAMPIQLSAVKRCTRSTQIGTHTVDDRNAPEFERVRRLFARVIDAAMQRSDVARTQGWGLYIHEGRFIEA